MRLAIVGAGAIGGYIGAHLTRAGADVMLVARGAHLAAIRERGLSVTGPGGEFTVRPTVTSDLADVRSADVVLLAVKAQSLPALAPRLSAVLKTDAVVVSLQNGLPWWYFQGDGTGFEGTPLGRIDPGGLIGSAIEFRRVVGAIVYVSADLAAPGIVHHTEGDRLSFGEPDGTRSDRTRRIAEALIAAGFRCPITTRIRHEIWVKLIGNAAFNPISAITRQTLDVLVSDPDSLRLARQVMQETEAVANALGIVLPISIEQRIAGAARASGHRTSMLQDFESGRPMEIEAIAGSILELGDRLGVAMPATHAVYVCLRHLDEQRRQVPAPGAPAR